MQAQAEKAEPPQNRHGIRKRAIHGAKPGKSDFAPIFLKKNACNVKKIMLLYKGCGMIAVKREVAAYKSRFSVERMSS